MTSITEMKRIRIELTKEIERVIGEICKKEGYQVSYAMINAALLEVLQGNNKEEREAELKGSKEV